MCVCVHGRGGRIAHIITQKGRIPVPQVGIGHTGVPAEANLAMGGYSLGGK